MKAVRVTCRHPKRRDALEEAARLTLEYLVLGHGPEFPSFGVPKALELHLSALALNEGCHLSETAIILLESLAAHGVTIRRLPSEASPNEDWEAFWDALDEIDESLEFGVSLEIV